MSETASESNGFGAANLPYGVDADGRVVVAYGDSVIDLSRLDGLDVGADVWTSGSLQAFFALGAEAWARTRRQLQGCLERVPARALRRRSEVRLVLPWEVADYADFYASQEHATHMGQLLRPGTDPLPPAWRYLPIGYHGRAATVVVSGATIPRPWGLRRAGGPESPVDYGPTLHLDVEVELGFVVGKNSVRGRPIPADRAAEHVFGVVLVNDWSARDIQAFEYQPLGPFLGKSFATSVSPWVVPLAALEPWWVEGPPQEPAPIGYLRAAEPRGLDVRMELEVNGTVVSTTRAAGLYWSMAQQLAHLTANGAAVRAGDLFASGTISGWDPATMGSLMELTRSGAAPLRLTGGEERAWLEDGDTAVIRGWCGGDTPAEGQVSFGEVRGTIVPSYEEVC